MLGAPLCEASMVPAVAVSGCRRGDIDYNAVTVLRIPDAQREL